MLPSSLASSEGPVPILPMNPLTQAYLLPARGFAHEGAHTWAAFCMHASQRRHPWISGRPSRPFPGFLDALVHSACAHIHISSHFSLPALSLPHRQVRDTIPIPGFLEALGPTARAYTRAHTSHLMHQMLNSQTRTGKSAMPSPSLDSWKLWDPRHVQHKSSSSRCLWSCPALLPC
eukprot:1137487-Pelagomonas_calceolata.AAC.2